MLAEREVYTAMMAEKEASSVAASSANDAAAQQAMAARQKEFEDAQQKMEANMALQKLTGEFTAIALNARQSIDQSKQTEAHFGAAMSVAADVSELEAALRDVFDSNDEGNNTGEVARVSALVQEKLGLIGSSKAEVVQTIAAVQQQIQASVQAVVLDASISLDEQQTAFFEAQKNMACTQVAQQVQWESQRVESMYKEKTQTLNQLQARLEQAVKDMKSRVEKNQAILEKEAALNQLQEGMAAKEEEMGKLKAARQSAALVVAQSGGEMTAATAEAESIALQIAELTGGEGPGGLGDGGGGVLDLSPEVQAKVQALREVQRVHTKKMQDGAAKKEAQMAELVNMEAELQAQEMLMIEKKAAIKKAAIIGSAPMQAVMQQQAIAEVSAAEIAVSNNPFTNPFAAPVAMTNPFADPTSTGNESSESSALMEKKSEMLVQQAKDSQEMTTWFGSKSEELWKQEKHAKKLSSEQELRAKTLSSRMDAEVAAVTKKVSGYNARVAPSLLTIKLKVTHVLSWAVRSALLLCVVWC